MTRSLLLVPLLHEEADLGTVGEALTRTSATLAGGERWLIHQRTVRQFWDGMRTYLLSLEANQLKLYHDGLAADGPTGRRIVEEAARRGSHDYRLVLELLDLGAELRRTEDASLLLREREALLRRLKPEADEEKPGEARNSETDRESLLEERDRFIGVVITGTLKLDELGVLFLGAAHDVAPYLADDVTLTPLKAREQVVAYLQELFFGHDERRLVEFARYLAAPVEDDLKRSRARPS